MTTIDFSRSSYAQIENSLGELRIHVWKGLQAHGPCTTAQLAERMQMSILTVRPRVTELMQIGLARLAANQPRGHEGVYEAGTVDDAIRLQGERVGGGERQPELRIGA